MLAAKFRRPGVNTLLRKVVSVCLTAVCLISGCASNTPAYSGQGQMSAGLSPSSLAATATRGGELQALTARGVVDALTKMGFKAPNPQDTTAQECPAAGCDQSIVTDTLRVKSFPSTGTAEIFAKDRGLYQVETIVVSFAPPVPQAEQDRYWAQIEKLVG